MIRREAIEWCDIWVTGADADSPPRLLLVGDSIARSYFAHVEAELKGQFLCARLTTSASVCHPGFQRELALLLDNYRFPVIHINNGLHGWEYEDAEYAKGLRRVLAYIARRAPKSRLIWANTTPVRQVGDLSALDPRTDRVRIRNRLAQAIAAARGLPVNDLFACVIDHPDCFANDGVHFNPAGQAALGRQVVQAVRA